MEEGSERMSEMCTDEGISESHLCVRVTVLACSCMCVYVTLFVTEHALLHDTMCDRYAYHAK